jgi:2-oxoglutarate dehydrogenase E1 component
MARASAQTSFLFGPNSNWLAEQYENYLKNPSSVDASWQAWFAELKDEAAVIAREMRGPSWAPRPVPADLAVAADAKVLPFSAPASAPVTRQATLDSIRALMLIRAYRIRGHMLANLDPLRLQERPSHPELDPASYGFGPADWDRPIFIDFVLGLEVATLRQIMDIVRKTYCGPIGVEFMHIQDPAQKAWIQERIEGIQNHTEFTPKGRRAILERLTAAEGIEQFLHTKFPGTKRFGLDGGEALIPAIEQVLKRGGQLGIKEVVFGMPHRGRLNVLTNIMNKRFAALFAEFQGTSANPEAVQGSGDVKYHLGASADREFDGNNVHLSLTANPSHLEAVDPVALGKVRAKQQQRRDNHRQEVLGILMHGDAAFAGQGLVAETLAMSELKGYRVGGTIHFIVNNQIGFTTIPAHSRSGLYATDVALMIHAPIFHVNGDDPEAVVHIARIATEYRQQFGKDVVIDMYCYRRYGHNEGDEPAFTQPLMYRTIKDHKTTRTLYAEKLVAEGALSADEARQIEADFTAYLETEFKAASSYKPNKADWLEGKWAGIEVAGRDHGAWQAQTGVSAEKLQEVGKALVTLPATFNANPKIIRQLEAKAKMFETGEGLDWATAEALAFGTLLIEGNPVRLSGQDCGRGTFSQRHAKLYDQETEEKYMPLNNIRGDGLDIGQAALEVLESPLSEAGVMGFEYGYTLAEPNALVLWEGQFGDFANGAQVIIDQFISSAESKWLRLSGLVLLLPHGYEGQGPEHSSARLERYLQLCAEDNMQVVNATTPANYFHVLRRQLRRRFRKPLVMMTPKSLLRHKLCVSPLKDFVEGTNFQPLIGDTLTGKSVKRVVLCSGKVYYDLWQAREERKIKDVALVRVEEMYPFPAAELKAELAKYSNVTDVVWCQEEPQNMGAWTFMDRRIEAVLAELGSKAKRPVYAGRPEAASPATGSLKRHNVEQAALVSAALGG